MKIKTVQKQSLNGVLHLPDLDHVKLSVLNTLRSVQSQRAYRIAIDDFFGAISDPRRICPSRIETNESAAEHCCQGLLCDLDSALPPV